MKGYIRFFICSLLVCGFSYSGFAQIGIFDDQAIIGTSAKSSFAYHASEQAYYFQPYEQVSANNMHFTWKVMKGNYFISGRVIKVPTSSTLPGIMIRSGITPQNNWIGLVFNPQKELCLVKSTGSITDTVARIPVKEEAFPVTLRLEKTGRTFTGYGAVDGEPMKMVGNTRLNLSGSSLAGLMTNTQKAPVTTFIKWDNVRVTVPYDESVEYREVTSRIEIMDIGTGHRKVIFKAPREISTPTWNPEGHYLIVNSNGELQRLSLEKGQLQKINTGNLRGINNDHGISPDGEKLVISHQKEGLYPAGTSTISLMPLDGGPIETVTEKTPSYWHGWSPDGSMITYVGNREEDFDIFSVPVDGLGEEKQLTTYEGLDDGPDFTPDGKYIYFCSDRTGAMQIWRMATDGSNKEQKTFDEYHDWFPHPSPDGKHIVFMSYEPEVPSDEHPSDHKVMLRMTAYNKDNKDDSPKTIAHLYGGQGTINVPSWSPDGKYVAFASYTYE